MMNEPLPERVARLETENEQCATERMEHEVRIAIERIIRDKPALPVYITRRVRDDGVRAGVEPCIPSDVPWVHAWEPEVAAARLHVERGDLAHRHDLFHVRPRSSRAAASASSYVRQSETVRLPSGRRGS